MRMKNTLVKAGLIASFAFSVGKIQAQDVHFTQFTASPLIVNPAFTGNFAGKFRAAAIYRDQWRSIGTTSAFTTIAASVDGAIINDLTHDDYLAAGVQLYNDRAGDGNLQNFTGLVSVAYHKFLGGSDFTENPPMSISVGLQAGYSSKSIDMSKLYFQDEFRNGSFDPGTSVNRAFIGNNLHYYIVNAGVSFSHAASESFSYAIGLGANNINQPLESFESRTPSEQSVLKMRYTAQAGAIIKASEKFELRPAVLYQQQASATELIMGNEFYCRVGNPEIQSFASAVFLGGWYRYDDAAMITAGFELKGFRVGVSYDYNTSALKSATGGNGGFEISLRYIAPNPLDFVHRLVYPCARF